MTFVDTINHCLGCQTRQAIIDAQARDIEGADKLRTKYGFTGSLPEYIAYLDEQIDHLEARRKAAEARVAALMDGLKFIIHHGAKASRQTLIDAAHKALTENTDGR